MTSGRRLLAAALPLLWALGACRTPTPASTRRPLRIGLPRAPLGLDPHLSNEFVSFEVACNVFEGLTALDGSMAVRPALAESWTSPDDATWHFRLRPGVRFHDGRPVQAADVAFSLERARRHPRSEFGNYLASVSSVKVLDTQTLEVVAEPTENLLLNKLAFVLVVPRDSPERIEQPVGTGPYRVARIEADGSLSLEAFEGYWGPRAAEPRVRLEVVPDHAKGLERFLAGDLDLLTELDPAAIPRVQARPGLRVVTAPSPSVDVLLMKLRESPFADPRVRRAASLALDRAAVVAEALQGQGRPAGQLVNPRVFGYDPGLAVPRRDLAQARRLLAEAGYPRGFDVDLEFSPGQRVETLARQLSEAGIRARPVPRPWPELLHRFDAGQVLLCHSRFISDCGDASDLLESTFHSPEPQRRFGATNEQGYSNPELDALIESVQRVRLRLDRLELLQRCMRLLARDLPMVPVLVRNDVWALRSELAWTPRADGRAMPYEMSRR